MSKKYISNVFLIATVKQKGHVIFSNDKFTVYTYKNMCFLISKDKAYAIPTATFLAIAEGYYDAVKRDQV